MKAHELRLDNWVLWTGNERQIQPLDFNDIIEHQKPYPHCKVVEPILLTNKWLEKFGFIWNAEINMFEKSGWSLMISIGAEVLDNEPKRYFLSDIVKRYQISECFYYVHQLQNLYFALTLKELVIIDSTTEQETPENPLIDNGTPTCKGCGYSYQNCVCRSRRG